MFITPAVLRKHDACYAQLAVFEEMFPNGCEVTLANCCRAFGAGLDLDWAARKLLPATARKAYVEATVTAWEAHGEARATAWKVYVEARMTAREVYVEAKVTAWEACVEATAAAFFMASQLD